MSTHRKTHSVKKLTVLLLLAVTLSSSIGVLSAKESSTEKTTDPMSGVTTTVYNPGWWNDPAREQIAIHTGQSIVKHLQSAAEALKDGKAGIARVEISSADAFVGSVLNLMPYMTINEQLYNAKGKLVLDDYDLFLDDMMPIYASLDQLELYAPTVASQTRDQVQKAEDQASKGDKKGAIETLNEVSESLAQTTVFMPLHYVHGQNQAALAALNGDKPNFKKATSAVNNALDSLTAFTTAVVADQPVK
jgi:hypothetical protein